MDQWSHTGYQRSSFSVKGLVATTQHILVVSWGRMVCIECRSHQGSAFASWFEHVRNSMRRVESSSSWILREHSSMVNSSMARRGAEMHGTGRMNVQCSYV